MRGLHEWLYRQVDYVEQEAICSMIEIADIVISGLGAGKTGLRTNAERKGLEPAVRGRIILLKYSA